MVAGKTFANATLLRPPFSSLPFFGLSSLLHGTSELTKYLTRMCRSLSVQTHAILSKILFHFCLIGWVPAISETLSYTLTFYRNAFYREQYRYHIPLLSVGTHFIVSTMRKLGSLFTAWIGFLIDFPTLADA